MSITIFSCDGLLFNKLGKGLFGKSLILLVIKLTIAVLAFVFHLMLARQLSVEQFGLFSLALSCLAFSNVLAKQGLEPAIVRYFAQQELTKLQSMYFYVLVFALFNVVLVGLVLFFLADFIAINLLSTTELSALFPLVIGLTAAQTGLAINSSVLKGRHSPMSSLLFTGLITYFCAILFLFNQPSANALQALELLFYSVIIALFASFFVTKFKLNFSFMLLHSKEESGVVQLISTSRVLFLSSLASLLTQQFAVLILARTTSLADIGIYSIALKVSLLMSYPLVVLNTITAPKYAIMYAKNEIKAFKLLAWQTTKGLIILATLMTACIAFFAENIVIFFGEHYLPAAKVLIILAVGQWFNLATGSVISMLVMTGHEKIHRRNAIIVAIFTVVAMSVFVPVYGIVAAAWITTITMAIFNLVSLYFVNRLIYTQVAAEQK